MSRMAFDQRLVAPVRMTAMGIWRNVEDGPQRVAPTLQQMRPLRRRPGRCSTREPRPPDRRHCSALSDAGSRRCITMTGAEVRATIRSRFVGCPDPSRSARSPTCRPRSGWLHRGPDLPPDERCRRLPVVVYAHGGGFVFCDLDSHDGSVPSLTNLTQPWSFRWTTDWRPNTVADRRRGRLRSHEVGRRPRAKSRVRRGRIAVGGDSAGGNLAAVTALMARDRGRPALRRAATALPVIAADFDTESYRYSAPATTTRGRRCSGTGTNTCPMPPIGPSVRVAVQARLEGLTGRQ